MSVLEVMDQYVDDVLTGEIVAGKWVKLACRRHRRDVETATERGIWFDDDAAAHAVDFYGFDLRHWKGHQAGELVELEPWQVFIIGSLFGWMMVDEECYEVRRYRTAYVEVGRKNGKTLMAAGVGLYLLVMDGEHGAEVYTAATKRDQARLAHNDAVQMVKISKHLAKVVDVYRDNLSYSGLVSKFEPLGRDADTSSGYNVHGAIIDEVHEHKTREMWDILETATGARLQPVTIAITTAGFDRTSICWELHDYTQKILDRVLDGDRWFGIIYAIDDEDLDNWEDERLWIKANPNLGVSKRIGDMRALADKAKAVPAALNSFLRMHLGVWTRAESRWLLAETWAKCNTAEIDLEDLEGRECYGGLDLSKSLDITAYVLAFPPVEDGDPFILLGRYFIPEDKIITRAKRDRVPYDVWEDLGLVIVTPGDWVDYPTIRRHFIQDAEMFRIVDVAYDRWNSASLIPDLMDEGFEMVGFGQGYRSMSPAMMEFETMVLAKEINHGGDPVLAWAMDNIVAVEDSAGNKKPDKSKSKEKIDPAVAAIMAMARAVLHDDTGSVYDDRGILTI